MHARSRAYRVNPESEAAMLIKAAADAAEPIRVDTGERVYRVAVGEETEATLPPPSAEDVAASVAGITAAAGSWVGLVDAEAFKAYLRARRKLAKRSARG